MNKREKLLQEEMKQSGKKISTIDDWVGKANQTFQLDLPSGNSVIVKKLDLIDLAISGYLPFDLISKSIKTAQELSAQKNWESISSDDLSRIGEMLSKIIVRSVVEPVIDETHVGLISFVDKFFIFSQTVDMRGAQALLPFRGE